MVALGISQTHAQIGTTLLNVGHAGETRRVFYKDRGAYLEVGEVTQGPLTLSVYGAPMHYHAVHLTADLQNTVSEDALRTFFSQDEPFLADLMDQLDAQQVRYGYLDTTDGSRVTFRRCRICS